MFKVIALGSTTSWVNVLINDCEHTTYHSNQGQGCCFLYLLHAPVGLVQLDHCNSDFTTGLYNWILSLNTICTSTDTPHQVTHSPLQLRRWPTEGAIAGSVNTWLVTCLALLYPAVEVGKLKLSDYDKVSPSKPDNYMCACLRPILWWPI